MPQASESQASGPVFGELEALFGSREPPKPIYRDKALRNLELNLTSDVNTARGGLNDALSGYRKRMTRFNPLIRGAAMESNAALSGLLNRRSPMADYKELGDYLFDKTQRVPDSVLNYLGNAQNISNLARGLSPGAASSYETLLRGGLASRAALDANRASLAALGGAFPALQNAIQSRDATMFNVFPARQAAFQALEQRPLMPYAAQLASLRDLQGLGMGQNALNMGNLQGYQPQENWANRLGAAGRASTTNINQLMDWASQAASIYGSAMGGGGMMGGGGGGGGGGMGSLASLFGGGGGGQKAPHWTDSYFQQNFGRGPNYPATQVDYNAAGQGTYGMPYGTTYNQPSDTSGYFWGQ